MVGAMRMGGLLIVVCLIVGCAAPLAGDETGPDRGSSGESVGLIQSALSSCAVLARRSIVNGVVETLLCDGVACTRTCSSADPTRCSTKCQNGPQLPPTQPPLDLTVLRTDCQIDPNSRVNAGWAGISKAECEGRGSCWDNRTRDANIPWCFEPLGKQPTCGAMAPRSRVNAGFPGISAVACVRDRAACWDDRVPNVSWCFQPIRTATPPASIDPNAPYRAFSGDFNGDGLGDLYIAQGNLPAGLPDLIPNLVLQNDGRGSFSVVAPLSAQQLAQVASFPPAATTIKYLDFNVDGIRDLYLKNVGAVVNGVVDQFVFGGPSSSSPLRVTPRSNALRQFFSDMGSFLDDKEYFNTVVKFAAGVPYELSFSAAFLAELFVTFDGVGFAVNQDFMDPTQVPHPACNRTPSPCEFEPGFGWFIFARITFEQNIYDYSGYPRSSIEAARIITDIQNERASAQALLNLIAQIYLVPVGGDSDLNDIEPWDAEHSQSYWILNEVLQVLLARYVSTDEPGRTSSEPIVELRAHRVGPFFSPLYHASVHLNAGSQNFACNGFFPTGDDWYSAFPSTPFGGKLVSTRKDKTDCPDRTVLMGDLNLNGFSAGGAWLLISGGGERFDDTKLTYCALPEINLFCRGFNSNSFAFGLTSTFGGFPLQIARKSPTAPPISTFRFPGSGTLVPASEFL